MLLEVEWLEDAKIDAAQIEQYKVEWKKHGFPDVDLVKHQANRARPMSTHTLNEPTWQPMVEQALWADVIALALGDYHKTATGWDKPCTTCHNGHACSKQQMQSRGSNGQFGAPRCPHSHTNHECAVRWFASADFKEICCGLGLDAGYFRKQLKR